MAWTDLSAAFGYGTKLTSTQQQQLRDNVVWVHNFVNSCNLTDHAPLLGSGTGVITPLEVGSYGAILVGQGANDPQWKKLSGAISVDSAGVTTLSIPAGDVDQSALATSMSSVGGGGGNYTLPGGTYGFYPQVRYDGTGSGVTTTIGIISSSSFLTNIGLSPDTGAGYAQQRYVTSSGEVFWIFILRDKVTKKILGMYQAPDHPCFGNGGKPEVVPHPFPDYDEATQEIVVINPTDQELEEMWAKCRVDDPALPHKDLLQVIEEEYEVNESSSPAWTTKDVTVGLPKDLDWKRVPDGTPVIPIKSKIPKPDYILCKSLKLKGA